MNYIHFGNSINHSLKEYGMVCRREKSDQYYFVYKVNEGYEEGFISETDVKEFLAGEAGFNKTEIKKFLAETANASHEDFIQLPILEKVYKLSNHFGSEIILGKAVAGLTLAKAVDMIETE